MTIVEGIIVTVFTTGVAAAGGIAWNTKASSSHGHVSEFKTIDEVESTTEGLDNKVSDLIGALKATNPAFKVEYDKLVDNRKQDKVYDE
jgi:hypothetical protein